MTLPLSLAAQAVEKPVDSQILGREAWKAHRTRYVPMLNGNRAAGARRRSFALRNAPARRIFAVVKGILAEVLAE